METAVLPLPPDLDPRIASDRIGAEQPDIVCLSSYVWNYRRTLDLVSLLHARMPAVPVVLGGPQVSDTDSRVEELRCRGELAHAVRGEGELALLAILGGSRPVPRPLIDLDALPNPYRTEPMLAQDVSRTATAIVEGARGCPFHCSFCDQGLHPPRRRDIRLVKEDLAFLGRLGARRIVFLDPTFNLNRARMVELLDFLRRELPNLTIYLELKVDTLTLEEIEALGMGNVTVEAGLQTSNPETLRRIRRPERLDALWSNVRELTRRGAHVVINTMFGLPGEGLGDWLRTLDDCYRETNAIISATCLKLSMNTEVYRRRQEYGYRFDERACFRAVESNTMSPDEFRKAARLTMLLRRVHGGEVNPVPILPEVRSAIKSEFGDSLAAFLSAVDAAESSS